MNIVENVMLDEERALYGEQDLLVRGVKFDGPADGESALKECSNIAVENCFFNLRYPLWHVHGLSIDDSELTSMCRAAIWYSDNIKIANTKLHGIKALRECQNVSIENCDVISPEFGWSVDNIHMTNCDAQSEYFLMRSKNIVFNNVNFSGKYSFQYIQNASFDNCNFQTKDAFWHGKNVYVKNSTIKGEYLAWYADGITFENCTIVGTQPLCYCKNLKLINCKMIDTDLCFEKSQVQAQITTPVVSIKNPYEGTIYVPSVGQIIRDDKLSVGKIVVGQCS